MPAPPPPDRPTAHVRYAYQLREGAVAHGRDHAVLDQPLHAGALHRDAGDALCRPRRKFRDLSYGSCTPTGDVTCPVCRDRAERYGIDVQPRPDLRHGIV